MEEQQQDRSMLAEYTRMKSESHIMDVRLDPSGKLLRKIENYLRGEMTIEIINEDGSKGTQQVGGGIPKANEMGIQGIMSWLAMTINPQTVQGNFPIDKHGYSQNYEFFIKRFRIDFMNVLMNNLYNYQISEEELGGLVDITCLTTETFMSRLIGDRERKSYGQTMQSREVISTGKDRMPTFK